MKLILLFFFMLPSTILGSNFKKYNTKNIKFRDSSIPYLASHPNQAGMNTYNADLKKIMSTLKCTVSNNLKDKTYWETFIGLGLVNEKIISVKIRSNSNCDNLMTVEDEDSSLTFDFTTRRKVELSDLFFKKPNTMKTIRKKLSDQFTGVDCRDKLNFYVESENLFKDHLAFYLSDTGIALKLKVPHGLKSCTKEAFISYKDILKTTSYTSTLKATEKLK